MSRRGENIYKRSDGRWEGRYISSRNAFGKAVYRSVYAPTYGEVKTKLKKCQSEQSVPCNAGAAYSFGFWADSWLLTVKMKCKISTYNKYKNLYNSYIYSEISTLEINKINFFTVQNIMLVNIRLSPKTRNDILCVIKQVLDYAEINGCKSNINLKNICVRQENREMRVLTLEEQSRFADFLLSDSDLCKTGVYLCLYTGLRIGELCALKYENISFEKGILSVRKTMQRVQIENGPYKTKVIITEPKSRNSVRDIPLPKRLTELLLKQYGGMESDDYILTGKNDNFIEPRLLEYRFKKYVKSCKLEDVNFHTLRHTFATRCIEYGFDVKTLSELLGHVNVNITLNRYVHSSMELKRVNMEKLCEIM